MDVSSTSASRAQDGWELLSMSMSLAPSQAKDPSLPTGDASSRTSEASVLDWREPLLVLSDGYGCAGFWEDDEEDDEMATDAPFQQVASPRSGQARLEGTNFRTLYEPNLPCAPGYANRSAPVGSEDLHLQMFQRVGLTIAMRDGYITNGLETHGEVPLRKELEESKRTACSTKVGKQTGRDALQHGLWNIEEDMCSAPCDHNIHNKIFLAQGSMKQDESILHVKASPHPHLVRMSSCRAHRHKHPKLSRKSLTMWSIAIAAGVVGVAIMGCQWQHERWQGQLLRHELLAKDHVCRTVKLMVHRVIESNKHGDVMLQINRLKKGLLVHHGLPLTRNSLLY